MKGRFIRCFGSKGDNNDQFNTPWDVCIEAGIANRLLITDRHNNRVSAWSMDGSQVIETVAVGERPTGICVDPRNTHHIVVALGSHEVKVFDSKIKNKNEWQLIQTIGSKGKRPAQFNYPYGVCIDDRGVLAVADRWNNRVQLF